MTSDLGIGRRTARQLTGNGINKIGFVNQTVEALVLDLLEWLSCKERSYAETMEVWRTSCPKLPVWEDAMCRGLVQVESANRQSYVRVTSAGATLLTKMRGKS